MQIARNIAAEHRACVFCLLRAREDYLAQRLISMESVDKGGDNLGDGCGCGTLRSLSGRSRRHPKSQGFVAAVRTDPRGARAIERIARYSQELLL